MLQKLPVSQSDFYFLRTANYLYIDKTNYIYQMLTSGGQSYFLARPRRFGKSLLVSTLYEALVGNKALFADLALGDSDYDWQPHGVIKLDLSMLGIVQRLDKGYSLIFSGRSPPDGFDGLRHCRGPSLG